MAPMKPAAVKVGDNQGRMAGRQLAVGFLQLVPGVFPTGALTPMKPVVAMGCVRRLLSIAVNFCRLLSIAVDYYRLLSIAVDYSYETRCAKSGGNQGRMAGRRLAVGFLQIVPGVFPTGVGY